MGSLQIYALSALLVLILDYPFIAYVLIRPIAPARLERRAAFARSLAIVASLLFVAGVFFGYFVVARFFLITMEPFDVAVALLPFING